MLRKVDEVEIRSLDDLKKFAKKYSQSFQPNQIVLLQGPMGAGKTQLVNFFLKSLGFEEGCSPTFALHNLYEQERRFIDHFDLYRLENELDLETSGFWESVSNSESMTFIEWSDRISESYFSKSLPIVKFVIAKNEDESRLICVFSR
ncbi:MAG: tRNA (adenosine(37)-N6)-threonylcarbamoyltransferase complex ATPase subunit type 1 TsaE [Bdellovibrionales bacterium]|nr:tRNA (adenosine(37)-N6)-threonylcarbamoyltransferase complex ATPase subunit type 1 TsaE [Bdellovibrionales bacterium]